SSWKSARGGHYSQSSNEREDAFGGRIELHGNTSALRRDLVVTSMTASCTCPRLRGCSAFMRSAHSRTRSSAGLARRHARCEQPALIDLRSWNVSGRSCHGFNEQIFGVDEQVPARGRSG